MGWKTRLENSQITILVWIDLPDAFKTVDTDILLVIPSICNISSSVVDYFASYLHGRQQKVRSGQYFYDWYDLVAGVPQGGILYPISFSIYIKSNLLNCAYYFYADDLQLYIPTVVKEIDSAISQLNLT